MAIESPTQRKARLAREAAMLASHPVERIAEGRSAVDEEHAAENAAERYAEAYHGARSSGLSVSDALDDANYARRRRGGW